MSIFMVLINPSVWKKTWVHTIKLDTCKRAKPVRYCINTSIQMCVFSVYPEELRESSVSVDQPVSKCVCFQFILKNYVSQVFLLTNQYPNVCVFSLSWRTTWVKCFCWPTSIQMCVFSVYPEELRESSVSVDKRVSKCVCFQFILKNYVSPVFLLTNQYPNVCVFSLSWRTTWVKCSC